MKNDPRLLEPPARKYSETFICKSTTSLMNCWPGFPTRSGSLVRAGLLQRYLLLKCLVMFLCLVLFSPVHSANQKTVCIVKSKTIAPFETAITGIISVFSKKHKAIIIKELDLQKDDVLADIATLKPDIVLTIGSTATEEIITKVHNIPVIFSMVLDPKPDLFQHEKITGVTLDIPIIYYFEKMRHIIPNRKRVGVIYNPKENQDYILKAKPIAAAAGFTLVPYPVYSTEDIPEIEKLGIDILWLIADKMVCQTPILKQILLKCIRSKKAVIGLAPSYTKAGALFSLSSDYEDIGRQTAELALRVLHGESPQAIPASIPRTIRMHLNVVVAEGLGITIPDHILKSADGIFGQ
ncbi:ABC transporter substrate-binding protein [candidate division CSSED10-310 bacterium]|uniref:ABC transporter substrate-binding protein n=1 Tax=candidate division CSSED10-310 bacterium TaxID=2855610 RepID=A0ABV6Z2D8_UNCC1